MKIHLFICCLCLSVSSLAQVEKSSELFKTLKTKDSLLFNVGFNTCDIAQFKSLLSEDFEFYHDQHGITNTKTDFISNIENGLCQMSYKAKRVLQQNSLEVFELKKDGVRYGAIQKGIHRFYAIEPDTHEYFTSIAKLTNVWLLENGEWKISRILSYDHKDKDTLIDETILFTDHDETERWLKEQKIPTLGIGFIEDGQLKEAKVYGNLRNGKKAPKNAVFNVASLTKPVTAMVALKLISSGKWDLDKPLSRFWVDPDLKGNKWAKKLSTRHVLNHQTGFPNWRWNLPEGKLKFQFEPGTKYQYSGEGIEYLRNALEKKFGKPLNILADELIFTPTSMSGTDFVWRDDLVGEKYVDGYDKEGKAYDLPKRTKAIGSDDLLTTVEDYSKFLIAVMEKKGLSDKVFNQMTTPQVETNKGKYFGLGFEIYTFNEDYALSHGGSDKGVQALVFIFPKSKKGLLIFTNVDDGYKVFERAILHYLGEEGQAIVNLEMGK